MTAWLNSVDRLTMLSGLTCRLWRHQLAGGETAGKEQIPFIWQPRAMRLVAIVWIARSWRHQLAGGETAGKEQIPFIWQPRAMRLVAIVWIARSWRHQLAGGEAAVKRQLRAHLAASSDAPGGDRLDRQIMASPARRR